MSNFLHAELLGARFPNNCKFEWLENNLTLDLEWTRWGSNTLFLRPRAAPLEMLWSCSPNRFPPDDSLILESIEWSFRRRDMTRCHRLGDTLIFINRNQGVIPHPQGVTPDTGHQSPFGAEFILPKQLFPKFQKPQVALLSPVEVVDAGLSQLAQDEHSDFSIASRWIANYRDSWSNIEFTILTRDQVDNLLRALWFIYAAEKLPNRYPIPVLHNAPEDKVVAYVPTPRWGIPQRLIEVFNVHSGLKSVKRGCFYYVGTWSKPANRPAYQLDIPAPNAQQRAEAILLWREFLRDKMEASEIGSLLSPT